MKQTRNLSIDPNIVNKNSNILLINKTTNLRNPFTRVLREINNFGLYLSFRILALDSLLAFIQCSLTDVKKDNAIQFSKYNCHKKKKQIS